MHKYIINDIPQGKIIDHINRNGLDNRKSNLRIVNPGQNMLNKRDYKHNKTGIRNLKYKGDKLCVGFERIFYDKEIAKNAANEVTKILNYYSELDAQKRKIGFMGEQIE